MTLEILLKETDRGHPISRKELSRLTGLTDRKVRLEIAAMQADRKPILSLDKGYFWGTPDEVESYKRREIKRATTILKKLKALEPNIISQLALAI